MKPKKTGPKAGDAAKGHGETEDALSTQQAVAHRGADPAAGAGSDIGASQSFSNADQDALTKELEKLWEWYSGETAKRHAEEIARKQSADQIEEEDEEPRETAEQFRERMMSWLVEGVHVIYTRFGRWPRILPPVRRPLPPPSVSVPVPGSDPSATGDGDA